MQKGLNRLQRRNKRRKIFWTSITVLVISFFVYQFIITPFRIGDLRKNGIITFGIVTRASNNQRNTGGGVCYEFYINNKKHEGCTGYSNLSPSFCESIVGRTFPLIY